MNWREREIKKKTRAWLLDQLDFNRPVNYVGLPAAEAIFEQQLAERFPMETMRLFERDEEIHRQAEAATEPLRARIGALRVHQGDVDDWVLGSHGPRMNPKDFIWLDYCGYINTRRLASLKRCIEGMPEDGYVAATFLAMREQEDQKDLMSLFDRADSPYIGGVSAEKHITRIRTVSTVALGTGKSLRIKVLPYYDKSPMLLFVFSRKDVKRTTIEVLPQMKE